MLLKIMGRGKEAVAAHDAVFSAAVHVEDKGSALYHKAAAMVMMGQVEEGAEVYRRVLAMLPEHFYVYLPLVECYKELGKMSRSDWKTLLDEIESAVDQWEDGSLATPAIDESIPSVISIEGARGTDGSTIYWALYTVAEKAGDYNRAWKYLEEAHRKDKLSKGSSFNEEQLRFQTEQITGIFKPGFWTPGLGSQSKLPIFIIGMMRYVVCMSGINS
jgi:tetratricopeptide (TPR) repeat protein